MATQKEKVEEVDVLIVGGGSAGLCAGVWLARNGIESFRILERRPGRLRIGQADGVQVRTVEVFESFGLEDKLLREAYHVLEDGFWDDAGNVGDGGGIRRTQCTPDTEAGLSHLPHVILNQAMVNGILTDEMEKVIAAGAGAGGGGEVNKNIEYGCEVRDVVVDMALVNDFDRHCVTVTAVKDGVERVYKAKYVLVWNSFFLWIYLWFSSSSSRGSGVGISSVLGYGIWLIYF